MQSSVRSENYAVIVVQSQAAAMKIFNGNIIFGCTAISAAMKNNVIQINRS